LPVLWARGISVVSVDQCARCFSLEVEAVLDRGRPVVLRHGVDRHAAGRDVLVAGAPGAVRHHLEVVVGGQRRVAVRAREPELALGAFVVRLEVVEADRPVEQAGPVDRAVLGADPELPVLEARGAAGPVDGRAADRLARPGRQTREVLGDLPRAGRRALVEPRELVERRPLVVDELLGRVVLPRLQQHHSGPVPAQLAGERAPAGAGADDRDDVAVVVREVGHEPPSSGSGSQSRSSNPRCR
jgi:hypothetical protein